MQLFLASGNDHKKREIQELFPNHSITIPKDVGINFDPHENGLSFFENSLKKAQELWNIVHKPVLADDSGICVTMLNNRPGIYSARYCGMDAGIGELSLSSSDQNRLLIEELNSTLNQAGLSEAVKNQRRCFYVCAMVFYYGDFQYSSVQETLEGELLQDISQQKGSGGFGYDPIVFLPSLGKTVSELTSEEKNLISHRGKACSLLRPVIDLFEKQHCAFR